MELSKRASGIILAAIILLSVGISAFFAINKQGFHEDEILSYHLANSSYDIKTDGEWNTPSDFGKYVAATNHRFDYVNVYKNQIADKVHPPFYYIMLHTICSFFPGVFSKYLGYTLNALMLALALIFLYLLCLRVTGRRPHSLIAAAGYGFSIAFMSAAVYIRMYTALTFFVLAFVYMTVKLYDTGSEAKIKEYIKLFFIAVFGMLTQYYFALYALIAGVVYIVLQIWERNTKAVKRYLITGALSVCASLAAYPYIIKNIIGENRGVGLFGLDIAPETIFTYMWYKIVCYVKMLIKELFAGQTWLFILVTVIALGIFIYKHAVKGKKLTQKIWFLIAPGVVSFGLLSLVTPFNSDRYIMASIPFISAMYTLAIVYALRHLFKTKGVYAAAACTFVISAFALMLVTPNYVYGTTDLYNTKTDSAVFMGTELKEWNKCIDKLMLYDDAMVINTGTMSKELPRMLDKFANDRGIITNGKIGVLIDSFIAGASHDEGNAGMKVLTDEALGDRNEITVYISILADSEGVIKYITDNTRLKNYELIEADKEFDRYYNWYDYFTDTESYCNVYRFYAGGTQ